MPDTFFLITGIVLAVIGGLILAAAVSDARSRRQKATGRVVRVDRDNARRWKGTYPHYPVVSYTADGKEYTVKSSTYTRIGTKYKIGQEIVIRYNPKSPKEMRVGVDLSSFTAGTVLTGIGAILISVYFM